MNPNPTTGSEFEPVPGLWDWFNEFYGKTPTPQNFHTETHSVRVVPTPSGELMLWRIEIKSHELKRTERGMFMGGERGQYRAWLWIVEYFISEIQDS
jgi:hypothetical protein